MPKRALITTDFPTPAEIAEFYKIPPARVAELRQMVQEFKDQDARHSTRRSAPKARAKKK